MEGGKSGKTPAIELVYPRNTFSSNEFAQIKKRLMRLTGSDAVRLNDREYTDKLIAGINREHEQNQRKNEQRLEEAEKARLRRLALEGVIPDGDGSKPRTRKSKKKRKKKKDKARPRTADEIHNRSREQLESYISMKRGAPHYPDSTWADHSRKWQTEEETTLVEVQSVTSCPTETDQESIGKPKRIHNKKHEPELIRKLHEEETVAGLYSIAAKLVVGRDS